MNDGIINRAIAWLFGANWSTAASGYTTVLAYFIHDKPEVIQWIPEPYRTLVWNASEWIFLGGLTALAINSKSRKVTGGTVQQDALGKVADIQEPVPPPPQPALPDTPTTLPGVRVKSTVKPTNNKKP